MSSASARYMRSNHKMLTHLHFKIRLQGGYGVCVCVCVCVWRVVKTPIYSKKSITHLTHTTHTHYTHHTYTTHTHYIHHTHTTHISHTHTTHISHTHTLHTSHTHRYLYVKSVLIKQYAIVIYMFLVARKEKERRGEDEKRD